jgi:hypothetical protein
LGSMMEIRAECQMLAALTMLLSYEIKADIEPLTQRNNVIQQGRK